MIVIICATYKKNPSRTVDATERTRFTKSKPNDLESFIDTNQFYMLFNTVINDQKHTSMWRGEARLTGEQI